MLSSRGQHHLLGPRRGPELTHSYDREGTGASTTAADTLIQTHITRHMLAYPTGID